MHFNVWNEEEQEVVWCDVPLHDMLVQLVILAVLSIVWPLLHGFWRGMWAFLVLVLLAVLVFTIGDLRTVPEGRPVFPHGRRWFVHAAQLFLALSLAYFWGWTAFAVFT